MNELVINELVIKTILENLAETSESSISSDTSSESTDSSGSSPLPYLPKRIPDFMKVIDKWNNKQFKNNFRLSRESLACLIDLYKSSDVFPKNRGGREKVGARKELHIFVWYVVNTITHRQMGKLFGINQVTSCKVVNRVASWLVSISNKYIIWPRSTERIAQNTASFRSLAGIPGVIGAIDGSHIRIKRPLTNPVAYYNRKGYYSIILQAVVDSAKRFIDVYCGEPGSLHDARVLRRSPLFRRADKQQILRERTILLGDSAYPLKSWLVAPYKDTGNLSDQKKRFNNLHSLSRIVVENAFELMKGRFRRLIHFTEHRELGTVKNIVVACCVLHNICVNNNDDWFDVTNNQPPQNNPPGDVSEDRRQELVNELIENNLL